MSYKTLANLNRNAVGKVTWCLSYACDFGNVPHGLEYAWQSYELAVRNGASHNDQNFPSVPVPVFLSYIVNGLNEGHVVWYVPGEGFYSSPYTARANAQYQNATATHALLPSIAEIERIYHVKFAGWATQLNGHNVAEVVADPAPTPPPAPAVEAAAPAPAPADNTPHIGDHVTTSATQDQNGTHLNLAIINDGQSVWAETNHLGHAVLTKDGVVRCGVPIDSLRKA